MGEKKSRWKNGKAGRDLLEASLANLWNLGISRQRCVIRIGQQKCPLHFSMNAVTGHVLMSAPIEVENAVYAVRDCTALKDPADGTAQPCKFDLGIRRPGCVENIK